MKRYLVAVVLSLILCSVLSVSIYLNGANLMGSKVHFVSHFFVISDTLSKREDLIWHMGKLLQVRKIMSLKYKAGNFQTLLLNSFGFEEDTILLFS